MRLFILLSFLIATSAFAKDEGLPVPVEGLSDCKFYMISTGQIKEGWTGNPLMFVIRCPNSSTTTLAGKKKVTVVDEKKEPTLTKENINKALDALNENQETIDRVKNLLEKYTK